MMDKALFRKKYLGEVTLKNGEHVKFCFSITEYEVQQSQIAAEHTWRQIHKPNANFRDFEYALLDDLNLSQFRIVFALVRKYGKNYWNLTWRAFCKKSI